MVSALLFSNAEHFHKPLLLTKLKTLYFFFAKKVVRTQVLINCPNTYFDFLEI